MEALGEKAMLLRDALALARGEMVALIGAGGKTTTMFHLAKELRRQGYKILVTTTTKIFKPAKPHVDRLFLVEDVQSLINISAEITGPVIIGAGCGVNREGKLLGMPVAWLDQLNANNIFDAILVEADGAASRLLKVPDNGEPVIPPSCQTTIWVVAIKVIGKPFTDDWVHRAARARDLLGVAADTTVSEELLLQLLQHEAGCRKSIPPASRQLALINQADSPEEMAAAQELGVKLQKLNFDKVVITSYANTEPVIQGITN